jgi:hypothetical protein
MRLYKGFKVMHDAGKVVLKNVFASPEGEFPQWVEDDPHVGTEYIDGVWTAFLIGEAKELYLTDEDDAESHVYPCMCGGAAGSVCEYCGGLAGVML